MTDKALHTVRVSTAKGGNALSTGKNAIIVGKITTFAVDRDGKIV